MKEELSQYLYSYHGKLNSDLMQQNSKTFNHQGSQNSSETEDANNLHEQFLGTPSRGQLWGMALTIMPFKAALCC